MFSFTTLVQGRLVKPELIRNNFEDPQNSYAFNYISVDVLSMLIIATLLKVAVNFDFFPFISQYTLFFRNLKFRKLTVQIECFIVTSSWDPLVTWFGRNIANLKLFNQNLKRYCLNSKANYGRRMKLVLSKQRLLVI